MFSSSDTVLSIVVRNFSHTPARSASAALRPAPTSLSGSDSPPVVLVLGRARTVGAGTAGKPGSDGRLHGTGGWECGEIGGGGGGQVGQGLRDLDRSTPREAAAPRESRCGP